MQMEQDNDLAFLSLSDILFEEYPAPPRSPTPPPAPSFFYFLKLPTEIRFHIYAHLLTKPGGAYIGSTSPTSRFTAESTLSNSQFFHDFRTYRDTSLTCRQIHSETTKIFYGDNGFEFCAEKTFYKFLTSSIQLSRQYVRRVRFVSVNQCVRGTLLRSLIILRIACRHLESLELVYREQLSVYHERLSESGQKACWDFHLKDLRNWFFRSPAYEGGAPYELRDVGITAHERGSDAFMSYRSCETEDKDGRHEYPIFEKPRLSIAAWDVGKDRDYRPIFYVVIDNKVQLQETLAFARKEAERILEDGGCDGESVDDAIIKRLHKETKNAVRRYQRS